MSMYKIVAIGLTDMGIFSRRNVDNGHKKTIFVFEFLEMVFNS